MPSTAQLLLAKLVLCTAVAAATPGFEGPPRALNVSRFAGKSVLFVTAHPDDAEFFAGGTIAAMRQHNVTVAYLIVTQGNAGGKCYDQHGKYRPVSYACETEELAFLRRREMLAAGAALGVEQVWRCGFGDGMLVSTHESAVRERISAFARRFRPFAVFSHYPYPNFRAPQTCNGKCTDERRRWDDLGYHPDHKRVGWHALNTFYGGGSAADNDILFPELSEAGGLAKWKPSELYFFALTADQPMTHYVPLSRQLVAAKANALAKHRSQYDGPPTASVEWIGRQIAREAQAPRGRVAIAEGFQAFF